MFRGGGSSSTSATDFAQSSAPINSYSQGVASGGYTVQRTGETLRSIAQGVWGDASLWYKLADANGMAGDMALSEGQHLTLPAGISRTTNTAATLKPYDAGDAIGNVSPTTPRPQVQAQAQAQPSHDSGCGIFGQILLVVVAIAVTALLKAPISTLLNGGTAVGAAGAGSAAAIGGAAAAGAAGSIVSQGVGLATGIQSRFSFSGVALGALGATVMFSRER